MNKQEKEKFIEKILSWGSWCNEVHTGELDRYVKISKVRELIKCVNEPQKVIAQLAEKWHEDIGPVLWWDFPVEEPPYCGTPLDDDFPKYKRHFTELHIPDEVEEEPKWVVKIEDNGSAYFVDFFDELQPHLVYGLSGEVMRFDSEDKANAIVTLIECGTVEKV